MGSAGVDLMVATHPARLYLLHLRCHSTGAPWWGDFLFHHALLRYAACPLDLACGVFNCQSTVAAGLPDDIPCGVFFRKGSAKSQAGCHYWHCQLVDGVCRHMWVSSLKRRQQWIALLVIFTPFWASNALGILLEVFELFELKLPIDHTKQAYFFTARWHTPHSSANGFGLDAAVTSISGLCGIVLAKRPLSKLCFLAILLIGLVCLFFSNTGCDAVCHCRRGDCVVIESWNTVAYPCRVGGSCMCFGRRKSCRLRYHFWISKDIRRFAIYHFELSCGAYERLLNKFTDHRFLELDLVLQMALLRFIQQTCSIRL